MKKVFRCAACQEFILYDEIYETEDYYMLIDNDKIFQGCIPKLNSVNAMCLQCVQDSNARSKYFND